MNEIQRNSKVEGEQTQAYDNSVKKMKKTLSIVVIACILAVVLLVAVDLQEPGHTVTFDSMGGTDVAPQVQMYGELLVLPEPPTREGYVFTGWYKDYACFEPWNVNDDTIQSELTLYAGWEKVQ